MKNEELLNKIYPNYNFIKKNAFGYFRFYDKEKNIIKLKSIYFYNEKMYCIFKDSTNYYMTGAIIFGVPVNGLCIKYKNDIYISDSKLRIKGIWLITFKKVEK